MYEGCATINLRRATKTGHENRDTFDPAARRGIINYLRNLAQRKIAVGIEAYTPGIHHILVVRLICFFTLFSDATE